MTASADDVGHIAFAFSLSPLATQAGRLSVREVTPPFALPVTVFYLFLFSPLPAAMEGRPSKPTIMFGGAYAKAKQRVLNAVGRRTTLTRNPRVDFISGRVDTIKANKARVAALASRLKSELHTANATATELNDALLACWKAELGERTWDADRGVYTRTLHSEEKRLVEETASVVAAAVAKGDSVLKTYTDHLDDLVDKPLTFNTPDEAARLEAVMETKEGYKLVRQAHSDAMIDVDGVLAGGGEPSDALKRSAEEAKRAYEEMSERLCEQALRYEAIYRDELAQRVAGHFTAQHLYLRALPTAAAGVYPMMRGLTIDWQTLRATRRANLEAAKRGEGGMGAGDLDGVTVASLPKPGGSGGGGSGAGSAATAPDLDAGGKNPFT